MKIVQIIYPFSPGKEINFPECQKPPPLSFPAMVSSAHPHTLSGIT